MSAANPPLDEQLLVCAARGRHGKHGSPAAVLQAQLAQAGIASAACPTVAALCTALGSGAGAAIVTDTALAGAALDRLRAVLAEQPAWSDVPIIVLTAGDPQRLARLEALGNVTLVDTHTSEITLVSAVRCALRARRRQYELRDYLAAQSQIEQALRESDARFRQTADNLPDGFIYQLIESETRALRCAYISAGVELLLGLTPAEVIADARVLHAHVLPEDLPRLRAAEEAAARNRTRFECAFRNLSRGGVLRWLHCRSAPRPLPNGGWVWDGLAVDITERVRAEEALREADRRKDEFLALLAHELRNPLAPIRNALHVMRLRAPADTDPELAWTRDVIERQVQQMTRLVDDLLDISRISRGKVQLHRERIEFAAIVDRAVETSRPLIDARSHTLAVVLPPEPVLLDADPIRLAQAVGNLLANAAKYTNEGGQITVSAELAGDQVALCVGDNGVGIPPEMLERIFELFTQVDRSLARADGGLGIGLTLVKRLVEMHGGTVAARSAGPGQGSEFTVRLPRV